VEEVCDRVDERLDECQGASDREAAGHGIPDGEGDAHVHGGEGDGLDHGGLLREAIGGWLHVEAALLINPIDCFHGFD
jgi:hypothetical protein